jgi:hypothetical protein
MQNEVRKHLLDRFQAHLLEDFDAYCAMHGQEPSNAALATFLIDRELLPRIVIQAYTVQREAAGLMARSGEDSMTKTQAVSLLAHRFGITERTVWNILKSNKSPQAINTK